METQQLFCRINIFRFKCNSQSMRDNCFNATRFAPLSVASVQLKSVLFKITMHRQNKRNAAWKRRRQPYIHIRFNILQSRDAHAPKSLFILLLLDCVCIFLRMSSMIFILLVSIKYLIKNPILKCQNGEHKIGCCFSTVIRIEHWTCLCSLFKFPFIIRKDFDYVDNIFRSQRRTDWIRW